MYSSLFSVYRKSFAWRPASGRCSVFVKSGGPCKQGETAAETGCIPANGEGGKTSVDGESPEPNATDSSIVKKAETGENAYEEQDRFDSDLFGTSYAVGKQGDLFVYVWGDKKFDSGEIPDQWLEDPSAERGVLMGSAGEIKWELENCVGGFRDHGDEEQQQEASVLIDQLIESLGIEDVVPIRPEKRSTSNKLRNAGKSIAVQPKTQQSAKEPAKPAVGRPAPKAKDPPAQGSRKDSLGRERCYQDGKLIPCNHPDEINADDHDNPDTADELEQAPAADQLEQPPAEEQPTKQDEEATQQEFEAAVAESEEVDNADTSEHEYTAQEVAAEQDWHSQYIEWAHGLKTGKQTMTPKDAPAAARFMSGLLNPKLGGEKYVAGLLDKHDGLQQEIGSEEKPKRVDGAVQKEIQQAFEQLAPNSPVAKPASELVGKLLGEQALPIAKKLAAKKPPAEIKPAAEATPTAESKPAEEPLAAAQRQLSEASGKYTAAKPGSKEAIAANAAYAKVEKEVARLTKEKHAGELHKGVTESLAKNASLSAEQQKTYGDATKKVFDKMPALALERFKANAGNGFNFYGDSKQLGEGLAQQIPKLKADLAKGAIIGGCYLHDNKAAGGLHLDGNFLQKTAKEFETKGMSLPHHTYAHEFAHAVDGPKKEVSGSNEWQEAWQGELAGGAISKYATTKASEGLAEFGRIVYSGDYDLKKVEKRFPKAAAVWKKHGIWPED